MKKRINLFRPITHTHLMTLSGGIDPHLTPLKKTGWFGRRLSSFRPFKTCVYVVVGDGTQRGGKWCLENLEKKSRTGGRTGEGNRYTPL